MKKLTIQLQWSPTRIVTVGQLAEADRRIYFEYDADFLPKGIELSPFKWPLRGGLIEHTDRGFGPLPGWIDDSLPDGWGLLLLDKMFRARGIDPGAVSPLERLSYLGTRTMGALTYHPPADVERGDRALDLHALGKNAQAIYRGDAVAVLPALLRAGGSPGGARPKVLVGVKGDEIISGEEDLPDGFEPWIVKFAAGADARDAGPMEFAYSQMARGARIDMPATRLFAVGKRLSYFGVRRFDRGPANRRVHTHTFGNLIHANFRTPSTDYSDLLKVAQALTRNHEDVLEVFRRMVFNIAAHNRDDHAKNFAFVMNELHEWRLSPAYDLVYSVGPGGEHSMTIAGEGRAPTRAHAMQMAKEFAIKPADADGIIAEVNAAIADWPQFAGEAGCSRKTIRLVQSHLRQL